MPSEIKNAKNFRILSFIAFLASLLVGMRTAFPDGMDTQFSGVGFLAPSAELIQSLGLSDPGNYMRVAVDLQDLQLSEENEWILNLWPPGMPFYLGILTRFSFNSNPTLFALSLFLIFWSLIYVTLLMKLIRMRRYLLSIAFTYVWLFSPLLTGYNTDYGVLASDGISSVLMAFAILILFKVLLPVYSTHKSSFFWPIFLGFLLATAAHFRMVWFFSILLGLTFSLIISVLRQLLRRKRCTLKSKREFAHSMTLYLLTVVSFLLCLIPWTLIAETKLHPGNYNWSNADYVWAQRWMNDQYLIDNGANFLVEGNANWSCEIAIAKCQDIYDQESRAGTYYSGFGPNSFADFRREALVSAADNPFSWMSLMTAKLLETWYTSPGASIGSAPNPIGGTLTLFTYLLSLVLLLKFLARTNSPFAYFLVLLQLGTVAILFLAQFESRYLIAAQVLGIVVSIKLLETFQTEKDTVTMAESNKFRLYPHV